MQLINILHVYKGNGPEKKNPIIDAQIDSFEDLNLNIIKFPLKTSGIFSYLSEFFRLRRFIKRKNIDLIHAHYSYSGIISGLTSKKTICSLMGSDVFDDSLLIKLVVRFFYNFIWVKTIVKSQNMLDIFPNAVVIPNGVNLIFFNIVSKNKAINNTDLKEDKINIIFVAESVHRKVKNYELAKRAVSLLPNNFELHSVSNKTQNQLVNYYNAADVLLLTSNSEGSPNVVKEAMACNCPIVSTDVGDVKKVINNTNYCYISDPIPKDISDKVIESTLTGNRSNGRENIKHLDSKIIAKKIVAIYKENAK